MHHRSPPLPARHFGCGAQVALLLVFVFVSLRGGTAWGAASEPPEQTAAALVQKALAGTSAMDIVRSLTTEVGPRLAGSEAEKRAAAWARDHFTQLGFDKVWIENFPLEAGWARGVEQAEVVSPSPQRLQVTALGGSVATPAGGIEAPIALFKTYEELLAAPPGSLTGKLAVVTQPMTRTGDGSGYGTLNKMRTAGPAEAARRGALGYLLRSLGTDARRSPHTGATRYATNVPPIPAAALSAPDAEQLERLAERGTPVRVKLVLTPRQLGPVTSQNVIAEIKGRSASEEFVLLGAHLDSWDLGTGALDDGAGVGIVMAAAGLIRGLPERPWRTIRVVLFGAEEFGIFGGAAYAGAHQSESTNHFIMAEPDVGQGPIRRFSTHVANPDQPALNRIRTVLATLGIAAGDNNSRQHSDLQPIEDLGVAAASLEMDASDYFDFHHTPDDTFDKLKPERLNQTTAAYVVFTYLSAELDGLYRVGP